MPTLYTPLLCLEAMSRGEDPMLGQEGSPTRVPRSIGRGDLDADKPRPHSWHGVDATHNPHVSAMLGRQGPLPAG